MLPAGPVIAARLPVDAEHEGTPAHSGGERHPPGVAEVEGVIEVGVVAQRRRHRGQPECLQRSQAGALLQPLASGVIVNGVGAVAHHRAA